LRRAEPWYRFAEWTVRPPLALWFNWHFEGLENIPPEGPVLVACNHISYLDPLAHAYMLIKARRRPRFLTKSELFGNSFLSRLLRGTGQIKVERGSGSVAPVEEAMRALRAGEAVMVYLEGTITRNPDYSPMEGKTGVARLTLATDVPVLPIAVWGSQHVWQREGRRSLKFGRPIWVKAGAPLDFSSYEAAKDDPTTLRKVTNTVMDELTRLVADLRARYPKRWS
jgi:1-acyl-sn-glycerol-3-phosphate acyltransferase